MLINSCIIDSAQCPGNLGGVGDADRHGLPVEEIMVPIRLEVARTLGRIDDARVDEHRRVLAGYDLPMRPPGSPPFDALLPLLARDKKALEGITFILDGEAGCEVVTGVDPEVLTESYRRFIR